MRFSPVVTNYVTVPPNRRWPRPEHSQTTTPRSYALQAPSASVASPTKSAISQSYVFTPPTPPYSPAFDQPDIPSTKLAPSHLYIHQKSISTSESDEDDEIFVDADDGSARNLDVIENSIPVHFKSVSPQPILFSLPTPPTTRRPESISFDRLSLYRRSLPILIALLVALILLICLTITFFIELEKIDAELHAHYRLPLAYDETNSTQQRHSRKLTSIPISEELHRSTWEHFISGFQLLRRLFLSSNLAELPTAFLFTNLPRFKMGRKLMVVELKPADIYQHPTHIFQTRAKDQGHQSVTNSRPDSSYMTYAPTIPSNPSKPVSLPYELLKTSTSDFAIETQRGSSKLQSEALFGSTSTIRPGVSPGIVPEKSKIERSELTAEQETPIPGESKSSSPSRVVAEIVPVVITAPVLAIPLVAPKPQPSVSNTQHTSLPLRAILHNGPVEVKSVSIQSRQALSSPGIQPGLLYPSPPIMQSKGVAVISPSPSCTPSFSKRPPEPSPTAILTGNQAASTSKSSQSKNDPDGIEVWHLPRGRYLCRLRNIARAEDGRVFVPKWMEKYREFISERCGLSTCVFGLDVKNGNVEIDATIARRELGNSFVIETTFYDRDLFSPDAPRQHMPHYISDVIRPLIASEILLGSGRDTIRPFFLHQDGQASKLVPIDRQNTDLKPSLLLRPETWNRPTTDWVRQFAGFFQNPSLGFTMIHLDRPLRSRKENDKLKLRIFQSVLTSKVNPYEPYGLFGTSGKNIVFARNGISRDPPWVMSSMHERPCRVSITALTRTGARALLGLSELEIMIKKRAKAQNMRAEFRVVDFTSMSFNEQVKVMQDTHVLIATHGAGNANIIFMRPGAAFLEVFPFSYKAGPFDGFARIFGLEYFTAMSAPQTEVFKACMHQHEKNDFIRRMVFEKWDQAVEDDKKSPWVHRLEFEKEFGEPGKSQGMTTRGCVRLQQLKFNIDAVSDIVIKAGKSQCFLASNVVKNRPV